MNGLGKTDTVYRLFDKLPVVNSEDTLQANASVMLNSKLKYPAYIGLDYFNDYHELIINSTEQEYVLGSPKEAPKENVRSSHGLSIYRIDHVWRIIQIDVNDSTLSEIDLLDEVIMVDDIPIEHYENTCDYQEYLNMKIEKKDSLVVTLKDSTSLKLPFRQNKIEKIAVYNKQ